MRFWDTSAIVTLLAEEPDSPKRAEQLTADPVMAVWWAAPVECESAIQRRLREGSLDRAGARLAQDRLELLAGAWHEVIPTFAVRKLSRRLLRTHSLRAADALQLAAALTLAEAGFERLAFICADDQLNRAAEKENLRVFD
ncbi:MAG: PIN domain-containing protein [Puniceicoccaceae bacterium]|nr:MAG: PIN domain-containing protein [Puniceicoccaceae bacterium]